MIAELAEKQKIESLIEIPSAPLSPSEYRVWITQIEERMSESDLCVDRHTGEDKGFPLNHTIIEGMYIRELSMPAGALVVSRIHMHEHPFVIMKGRVSVFDGESSSILEAPFRGITKVGTKRILYCHEPTVWVTFHPTDKTTLKEIDENGEITCDTFEEFDLLRGDS